MQKAVILDTHVLLIEYCLRRARLVSGAFWKTTELLRIYNNNNNNNTLQSQETEM